jgi:hypothetical protein
MSDLSPARAGPPDKEVGVGPPPEKAEKAADRAVSDERLLPGEDPSSRYPEDATHWITVYSELLAFKQEILRQSTDRAAVMIPAARREVETTDLIVLRAEEARLERRLGFWQQRLADSGGT